jgi:hypothetical protein
MSTKYQSSYDNTLSFSDMAPSVNLAASTALSYTVPGDNRERYVIEFSYNDQSNIYITNFGTAAVPSAGTVSASSRSEYRPHKRFANAGDVLSFITPDASGAFFGFSLRQIPNP